ncbi:ABC1 kinase family protein [Bilifractor sp. HCP3S3_D3]|uniref:ABC1 kinase family protein n=1 Tax=Bilifractor sp. HCP3S3_D3 TaxID=3438907 RepID=UPI003F89813B
MNHAEENVNNKNTVPEKPEKKPDSSSRLKEITQILLENKVFRGVTPEKLRIVIEELGPTYIKLGQIMSLHSDILPKEYCTELMKLNSEVTPMPFSDVISVIETSYGDRWSEIFESIDPVSLGSASIAQVHRARLKTGENVIIKVQRKGIYDTMSRDIRLLHRAVRLLPSIGGLKNVVDLSQVLDELWSVAQEEMNFLKEADNMEEFARCNSDVAFVDVPTLYRRYTTSHVLVMEYIDGFSITDTEALQKNGYDLHEIGAKLVDNYIKQVINDGFFHADPHPGNLRIRDGKIIWIDMGMMGRLNERERGLLTEAVKGIADHDVSRVENAVLSLADFRKGKPDREQLYQDLRDILQRYGDTDIAGIDIADFFMDVMDAMKKNRITMPHGLTMLARGLTHMEGDLAEISPDINMAEIASQRIQASYLKSFDWKEALSHSGQDLFYAARDSAKLPSLMSRIMKEYLNGQSRVNLELKTSKNLAWLMRKLVQNIVIGMWVVALLISSSILCLTDMHPKILGMPLLGFLGYSAAGVIVLFLVIRHFATKPK